LACALVFNGCSGPKFVAVPSAATPLATEILFVESSGVTQAFAEPSGASFEISGLASDDTKLTLLRFAESLDQLQLARGLIPAAAPGGRARFLPSFAEALELSIDGFQWTSTATIPSEIARFQLPPFSIGACVDRGGCLRDLDTARPVCVAPCDD